MSNYINDNSLREPPVLKKLRDAHNTEINMVQDQLFRMLLKMTGAKKCLIAGKYTGYSALSCALSTAEGAEIHALDFNQGFVDENYKPHFEEAKVNEKIKMKIGNTLESMDELIKEGHNETFDFIYISDEKKLEYENYLERAHVLVKIGGVIAMDSMLLNQKAEGEFLDKLNKKLHKDIRFDLSLLNVDNGLTLLRRVEPR